MLKKILTGLAVLAFSMSTSVVQAQEVPTMKMTTEIPEGVTTPDNIQTRVGALNFFDGVPDVESAQKVYNLLDFTHAYQTFLDGTKIASMGAIRKGILDFGPANETVVLFQDLMDSKSLFLTANTTSVYMFSWLDLGDEPMVIKTRPTYLDLSTTTGFAMSSTSVTSGRMKARGANFLFCHLAMMGKCPRVITLRAPIRTATG